MTDEAGLRKAADTLDSAAARMVADLLWATHLSPPGELAGLLAEKAALIGARDLAVYLIDYEQSDLVPVPSPTTPGRKTLRVEGTIAGRAFASSARKHGGRRAARPAPAVASAGGRHRPPRGVGADGARGRRPPWCPGPDEPPAAAPASREVKGGNLIRVTAPCVPPDA